MKTDTKELAAGLRRIADGILFGRPALIANQAADRLEELEEQLAANHAAIKLMSKWLEDERALADRLARTLDTIGHGGREQFRWSLTKAELVAREALAAWKEARNDT